MNQSLARKRRFLALSGLKGPPRAWIEEQLKGQAGGKDDTPWGNFAKVVEDHENLIGISKEVGFHINLLEPDKHQTLVKLIESS